MDNPNEYSGSTFLDGVIRPDTSQFIIHTDNTQNSSTLTPLVNSDPTSIFVSGTFIANSSNYDPVIFSPFIQHKPTKEPCIIDSSRKEFGEFKLSNKSGNESGKVNYDVDFDVENTRDTSVESVAYWSRETQLPSPFGVLPHEIPSDSSESESRSPYVGGVNIQLSSLHSGNQQVGIIPISNYKNIINDSCGVKNDIPGNSQQAPVVNAEQNSDQNSVIRARQRIISSREPQTHVNKSASDSAVKNFPPGNITTKPVYTCQSNNTNVLRLNKTTEIAGGSTGIPVGDKLKSQPSSGILAAVGNMRQDQQFVTHNALPRIVTPISKSFTSESRRVQFIPLASPDLVNFNTSSGYKIIPVNNSVQLHPSNENGRLLSLSGKLSNASDGISSGKQDISYASAPFNRSSNVNNIQPQTSVWYPQNKPLNMITSNAPSVRHPLQQEQLIDSVYMNKFNTEMQANQINVGRNATVPNMQPRSSTNVVLTHPSVITRNDKNYQQDTRDGKIPPSTFLKVNKSSSTSYSINSEINPSVEQINTGHHRLLLGLTEKQHSYFDSSALPNSRTKFQNVNGAKQVNLAKSITPADNIHVMQYRNCQSVFRQSDSSEQMTCQQQAQYHAFQENFSYADYKHKNRNTFPTPDPCVDAGKTSGRKKKPRTSHSNNANNMKTISSQCSTRIPQITDNKGTLDSSMIHSQQQSHSMNCVNVLNRFDVPNYNLGRTMEPSEAQGQEYPSYHNNIVSHVSNEQLTSLAMPYTTRPATLNSSSNSSQSKKIYPPTIPLSAYFSSFHPSSTHYSHQELHYHPNDTTTHHTSCSEFVLSSGNNEHPRVIVPNIEEELDHLSGPIFSSGNGVSNIYPINTFSRRGNFLQSYIRFLQGVKDDIEEISSYKNWARQRTLFDSIPTIFNNDKSNTTTQAEATKESNVNPTVKKSTSNRKMTKSSSIDDLPDDYDPRYYPLPKSAEDRRLSSSSEDESSWKDEMSFDYLMNRKNIPQTKKKLTQFNEEKKTSWSTKKKIDRTIGINKNVESMKGGKPLNGNPAQTQKGESGRINSQNLKGQLKPSVKTIKQLPPRREPSKRKAKENGILKIQKKYNREEDDYDDFDFGDSDVDPCWSPSQDDEATCSSKRKSKKSKVNLNKSKNDKGQKNKILHEESIQTPQEPKSCTKETSESVDKQCVDKISLNSSRLVNVTENGNISFKSEQFVILKTQLREEFPIIWRVDGKSLLQKFEPMSDNKNLYHSVSTYTSWSEHSADKYQAINVDIVQENKHETIVMLQSHIAGEIDLPLSEIEDKFMNDTMKYKNNFAIYTQTLLSQAIDSSFLKEIIKENDEYFLSNVKIIDEVTRAYENKLESVISWKDNMLGTYVKTNPNFKINAKNGSQETCVGCNVNNSNSLVMFYGFPYDRTTLQGCFENIQSSSNVVSRETANLCDDCVKKIKVCNKIYHQKYLIFSLCVKCVLEKRKKHSSNSTGILNEILADGTFLNKLFADIRTVWLEIVILEHSSKK